MRICRRYIAVSSVQEHVFLIQNKKNNHTENESITESSLILNSSSATCHEYNVCYTDVFLMFYTCVGTCM